MTQLTAIDRKLIAVTAAGLPIVARPYAQIADETGLPETDVLEALKHLTGRGIIRRIAAAPNHYKLGLVANGMTVWDVDDDKISGLGARIGALPFVTHCYRRPRALPDWPFNLFAMVHCSDREAVERKRGEIAALLGPACRASDILYSTSILKKTGLRLSQSGG